MKPGDKARFNDLGKRLLPLSNEVMEKEYEVREVVKATNALNTPQARCDTYARLKLNGRFIDPVWTCFLEVVKPTIEIKEIKKDRFEMVLEAVK